VGLVVESGASTPPERHPQFFAVVEEVLFGAALGAVAVRDLLIRAVNFPGMRTSLSLKCRADSRLLDRVSATVSLRSSLDH